MYVSDSATSLPIHCLSVSHRLASDSVRESLAFPAEALAAALESARRDPAIQRLVVVSTCHRVELYAALPAGLPDAPARLVAWLAESRGVGAATIDTYATHLHGAAAVRHLCRVACGLDAAILGEAQVLAQVAGALRVAVAAHTVTPLLKDVFRSAVSVGERARRVVWARYRAADIGWAAAEGAAHALNGLTGATAVVVGAGDVANLAVDALRARGVGRLTVVNRTLSRAEDIAARHGVEAEDMSALADAVRSADVVIVATGAGSVVIDAAVVEHALAGRADRPLVVVDAALPRNVDAAVRGLPGAQLLDLTDLRPHFASASDERQEAAEAVEALIEAEVHALLTRRKGWRSDAPAARSGPPLLASA